MNIFKFSKNWKTTLSANFMLTVAVTALAIAVVFLAKKVHDMHERLVLIPPMLTRETVVAWNEAERNYFEGWGMYSAVMIASATPQSATFVSDHIKFIFDPEVYGAVKTQLLSYEKDPTYSKTGTFNVFTPKTVTSEASTNRVFVSGELATNAYRGETKKIARLYVTYEMTMAMRAGLPKVLGFDSYVGQPRTTKWEREHAADAAKLKKSREQKETQIVPQESEIQHALESGEATTEEFIDPQESVGPSTDKAAPPNQKKSANPGAGQDLSQNGRMTSPKNRVATENDL